MLKFHEGLQVLQHYSRRIAEVLHCLHGVSVCLTTADAQQHPNNSVSHSHNVVASFGMITPQVTSHSR